MAPMFKLIGCIVAGYTIYSIFEGEVGAKSGIRWQRVSKEESPRYFWSVIAIYGLLSVALITLF